MNRAVLTSLKILCLLSTALLMGLALNTRNVKASGTVYIRADGSVDPPAAPISSVDNVTYTFIDDIYDTIVVERDNTVVDGAGYKVQGTGSGIGVHLNNRDNVTVKNMKIEEFQFGVRLDQSSNNKILENTIENNWCGIWMENSSENYMSENHIAANTYGVWIFASNNTLSRNTVTNSTDSGVVIDLDSSNNTISGNNITSNNRGVWVILASGNKFCHNNFIENTLQVDVTSTGYSNSWDDGYPSGGNYWSDYTGVDSNHDGLGDTSYVIVDNQDKYPLMGVFSVFKARKEYYVKTISNSTTSNFSFGVDYNGINKTISLDVTGAEGTAGFCRMTIPRGLIDGPYAVLISGEVANATELPVSNRADALLYFMYVHSTHTVVIFSWEDLLNIYIELLGDYQSLNTTYYELQDLYSELLADYNNLISTHRDLLFNYTGLLGTYDSLQTNYTNLQSDYDSLNSALSDLQEDYDALNALFNNLNASYNELESEQEAAFSRLNTIRDLMYAFIATTMFFIVTTVYFATRKPKTRPTGRTRKKS
ncbi:MAG: NosD domain-containing protein [Candidatus Bathyarchaeia archaeon]